MFEFSNIFDFFNFNFNSFSSSLYHILKKLRKLYKDKIKVKQIEYIYFFKYNNI